VSLVEAALRSIRPTPPGSDQPMLATGDAQVIAAFPDALLVELARDIGAEPEALASPLARWACLVLGDRPTPPAPRETRAELRRLSEALERAEELAEAISPDAAAALSGQASDFARLRTGLARFSLAVWRASNAVEVRKGPAPRTDLDLLVRSLAEPYELVTGNRAGRRWNDYASNDESRFPTFCRRCIQAVLGTDPGTLTGKVQEMSSRRMRQ
jgi:hypothetical protein